jgi:hypothetical protein
MVCFSDTNLNTLNYFKAVLIRHYKGLIATKRFFMFVVGTGINNESVHNENPVIYRQIVQFIF